MTIGLNGLELCFYELTLMYQDTVMREEKALTRNGICLIGKPISFEDWRTLWMECELTA